MTALPISVLQQQAVGTPVTTAHPHLYVVGSNQDPYREKRRRQTQVRQAVIRQEQLAAKQKLVARLILFSVITVLVLLAGLFVGSMLAPAVDGTTLYQVSSGESLWEIASHVRGGRSVADTVAVIQNLNQLSDSVVEAGQTLVVPAG